MLSRRKPQLFEVGSTSGLEPRGAFTLWHREGIIPTPYPGIVATKGCPGHRSHPFGEQKTQELMPGGAQMWLGGIRVSCCCWEHLALPLCPGALEMGHVLIPEELPGFGMRFAGLGLSGSL